MSFIHSSWAESPIDFSNPLSHDSWAGAEEKQLTIPHGFMMVKNDAKFAYIALDLVDDTNNDPGTGDYFWLTFDRNRNRAISPNVDVNYGLYPGQPNKMGRQYYVGPSRWTGLINEESSSECRIAFEGSPNAAAPHRIWKIRIKLSDINVNLMGWFWFWSTSYIDFGLKIASSTPAFQEYFPPNFTNTFTYLHRIYFSRKPVISSAALGPVMGSVGLIPTTKIGDTTGKATTDPGYYVKAQNHAFGGLLNIIGNRAQLATLRSAGAVKYRVKKATGSGAFSNFRSAWSNYKWDAAEDDYILESFGADSNDYYPMLNPAVDYSIDDLLVQFDSRKLPTGIHRFQVEFFNSGNAPVAAPPQVLTLYIDNNVPQVHIDAILHGGAPVPTCAIVQMTSPSDGVVVRFDATDVEGNLERYLVRAEWGDGAHSVIESVKYDLSMGANWTGVNNKNAPLFVPVVTCAHEFSVHAWARTTNGYGRVGYNKASRHITIKK